MMQQNPNSSPSDSRNLIIALALAAMVMFGWQYFYEQPRKQALLEQQKAQQKVTENAVGVAALPAINNAAPAPVMQVPQNRADALMTTSRIRINTPELHGSINLKGARFDDLTLASYNETTEEDSEEVALLTPRITGEGYFAEFGWVGADVPGANTIWQADNTVLNETSPVTLQWTNNRGVVFTIKIAVDEHYMFTITRRIENGSLAPAQIAPYSLINRTLNEQEQQYIILHQGPLGVSNGVLHEHDYDDLEDSKIVQNDVDGWSGITDKYWLTALIPDDGLYKKSYHYYQTGDDKRYQTDMLGEAKMIPANGSYETTTRFFAGAKKVDLLDSYAEEYNIPLFDRAVDFGVLYFLTRPIFEALRFFHSILGNFGLAILGLTVIIKAIMFPLANKSYAAMSQMKLLMPKMKDIRERHGEDRVKMNQEIMQLYKKEGVNPAAGCLPMLLQIPVFFALYKVLFISIEMRHAPFYGWIEDLSVKDPTNLFTLFGTVPWGAPDWLHVGVLPLIMTFTMIIQQKLNPKPADPTQAQVMQILPYMFLFLFASFPAGLVLYWAWNNTLSVIQQYAITKRFEKLYDKETGKRIKQPKQKNKA